MNSRQLQMLRTLMGTNHYIPTAQLAKELKCSDRTVRSDMAKLNSFLEQNGISALITSKPGNGLLLECNIQDTEAIRDILEAQSLSTNAALYRFYLGILYLFCDVRCNYTVESLSRVCLSNKQQIQDDLREWDKLLAPFGGEIQRGRHLSLAGDERNLRFFVVYYLFEFAGTEMRRNFEPGLFQNHTSFLRELVNKVESKKHTLYTDNARHQMITYIQISIYRIRKKHCISEYAPEREVEDIYNEICDLLEDHYRVILPHAERLLIQDIFAVSTRRWTIDTEKLYRPNQQAAMHTISLFSALELRYGSRPSQGMFNSAAFLIEQAIMHRQYELAVELPSDNSWAMRYTYMPYFMRVTEAMFDTESLQNLDLYNSDYTRIAMLMLSYMEDAAKDDIWNVGLVVNCGIEQAYFAISRIEKTLQNAHITKILTEAEALTKSFTGELSGVDILIGFTAFESSIPHATISASFSEEDVMHINSLLLDLPKHSSARHTPLKDGLTHSSLEVSAQGMLRHDLFRDLVEREIWLGTEEEFVRCFEANSLAVDSWIIFSCLTNQVSATDALLYETKGHMSITGVTLDHVAVLTVSIEDRDMLNPITQNFKHMLIENGLPKTH